MECLKKLIKPSRQASKLPASKKIQTFVNEHTQTNKQYHS